MRNNLFVRGVYVFLMTTLLYACAKDKGYYSPTSQQPVFKGNLYSYLKSKPGVYDSLVKVIDRIGLQKKLEDSTVTLFALTNANFQLAIQNLNNTLSVSDKPAQYLNSVKYEILDSLLCQYIIQGRIGSDSLSSQDGKDVLGIRYGYPMHIGLNKQASSGYLNGGPTIVDLSDTRRSVFNRNWVTTETSSLNIQTDNAVVHVLNPDHVFGFNKFVSQVIYIPPPENLFKTIGGQWSASKETSGGPDAVEASKYVFDGNPETKFFLSSPGLFYLQWDFPSAVVANSYTLRSANDIQGRDPADWNLQGLDEQGKWITLDIRQAEEFDERFQLRVFFFTNTKAYKAYRLNIIRMYDGNDFQLADWTMNRNQ